MGRSDRKRRKPQIRRPASQPVAVDVLERLGTVVDQRDELMVEIEQLVLRARRDGRTWTDLGRVLGVSPQAVQKRYGRV